MGNLRTISQNWPIFRANEDGGIAITFAFAAPVIALLACGAVDLAAVSATKADAQGAVDAAALNVAHQLGVGDSGGIPARAEAQVDEALLERKANGYAYAVTTEVDDMAGTLTVRVDGKRQSFFGNILPPGGWHVGASATAAVLGSQPLCVLSFGTDDKNKLELKDDAQVSAPGCLVQSNGDIKVGGQSRMSAGTVQAAGSATGAITPKAQVGSPQIDDPFASLAIKPEGMACGKADKLPHGDKNGPGGPKDTTPLEVPAGVHCGDIKVSKDQSIRLLPGEHYFLKGKLTLDKNAILTGDDVVLIFDKDSDFDFKEDSKVSLGGREKGAFQGFVLATTRENNHVFSISSSSAAKFLGTIYVPSATLQIEGKGNKVANESAWTVIVAQALKLQGSPKLVVNSKYAGSPVPVPQGVGPRSSNVTLAR